MPFLNTVKDPKSLPLLEVRFKPTKNGDPGVFLKTQDYSIFLWAESKMAKTINAILSRYIEDGKGFQLMIVPDSKAKEGFTLKKGKPSKDWNYSEGVFSTYQQEEEINLDDFF